MTAAPAHLRLAFMLALWSAQRQGDLLRMAWDDHDRQFVKVKQRRTAARVRIPVDASPKVMLDEARRTAPTILTTIEGRAWTGDGFRASWSKARKCGRDPAPHLQRPARDRRHPLGDGRPLRAADRIGDRPQPQAGP